MIIIQGVDYMFLRKLGKRGVAMTEYAVLLAFVAAIGGSFASDNELSGSITNAVSKAASAIGLVSEADGPHALRVASSIDAKFRDYLEKQTGIMYTHAKGLVDKLNGSELLAVEMNMAGTMNKIWYKDAEGNIKSTTQCDTSSLNKAYDDGWNNNPYCATFSDANRPAELKNASMYVAYDQYGNVVQSRSEIADKTTSIYATNKDSITYDDGSKFSKFGETTHLEYDDSKGGFYASEVYNGKNLVP